MRAAQRKKMVRGDLLMGVVILFAAAALAFLLLPRSGQALTVQVVLDGKTVLSCRLDELSEPVQYTVDGPYPLTLELSASGVSVTETACPGEDCRHMGTISQAGRQIVCLPNRLVVTLEGANPSYDAMTG